MTRANSMDEAMAVGTAHYAGIIACGGWSSAREPS